MNASLTWLDGEKAAGRARHWKEIARSSAKQSDRARPAEISQPVKFHDLAKRWKDKSDLKVILWEEEESTDLKELLRSSPPSRGFIGMVGPEGGFSQKEVEVARDAGFISVSLGNRILRAETAAITLVAIVQYEWGDLSLNDPAK